jgi:rod shape-determining protein MreD
MGWIFIPALLALVGTILLGTPVQLFGLRLPEPLLPMVLAFAWPLIRPSMLAPAVLFLLGAMIDILLGRQLGLSSLMLLAVYGAILGARSFLIGQETPVLFLWYAVSTTAALSAGYIISTISSANAPSILAFLGFLIPTLLLFPLADRLIERFDDGDTRFR